MLGQSLMRHTDNRSKGLQHQDLSASKGQSMGIQSVLRDVKQKADNVDEPSMLRKRKVPKRFQLGDA
ncbi:hypothetical protein DPMN_100368 [Dreissena polymorpha]|uniref:Uncharacterized protein n=1 Tax=Dreissena polymorpha TaxID=45954 RepID=A0A9D4LFT3_DREPO|nr:hypothetical protein DPMN_100368 [Dreissena polymorpha]